MAQSFPITKGLGRDYRTERSRCGIAKAPQGRRAPGYRVIQDVADRMEPKVRSAFLAAVKKIRDRASIRALTEALQSGSAQAVMDVLGIDQLDDLLRGEGVDPDSFRGRLNSAFVQAGEAAVPEFNVAAAANATFDLVNPKSLAFIDRQTGDAIREISNETKLAVRAVIRDGFDNGVPPRQMARRIKTMVGTTRRQSQAVMNFRAALESRDATLLRDALNRKLRDRRFDGTLRAAIRDPGRLTAEKIDRMVERFATRMIRDRAENIARTETISASNAGQEALWRQAVDEELISPDSRKRWVVTPDDRLCEICAPIPGMNVGGVPIHEPFQTPIGPRDRPTAHPRCRCAMSLIGGGTS